MRRILPCALALVSACSGLASPSVPDETTSPPSDDVRDAAAADTDAAETRDASLLDAASTESGAADVATIVDASEVDAIAPVDASGVDASDGGSVADASDSGSAGDASDSGAVTDASDGGSVGDAGDASANDGGDAGAPAVGWTKLAAGGLPAGRVRAVAVGPTGAIFAAVQGFGVFVSTNLGVTFTKLGAPLLTNDLPYTTVTTLVLNALGEPVVGMAQPGSGTGDVFIARLDKKSVPAKWITASVSQSMNLGGYFPPAFRHDVDGALLSTWPFRNDVMRSTDEGSSWTGAFPIPNAAHVPPLGPSATVKAVYGVGSHATSGELFVGTEGDQWWHSTDRGASWSMIDQGGTSSLALEPGQNGFLVAFDKDGNVLFGTQGKPDGHFLVRWSIDGAIGVSDQGFPIWGMVGTANETTVLRELVLTAEGDNYLAMPIADGKGGALAPDVYRAPDGAHWQALAAPFVPELNALAPFGEASIIVGGGAASPGQIWIYTPKLDSHLPRVSTGAKKGAVLAASLAAGLTLVGSAKDADGDPLTFAWHARGPGAVTFGAPASASTTASFSAVGDYTLTLVADDGHRSAGASVLVHVE